MNNLKRSITGKYNADDVDKLLKKVRNDYENCLKEQKNRIIALRDENKEMSSLLSKYKENEQFIIGAITKAEQTARAIISDAEQQAKKRLQHAEAEEVNLRIAVQKNYDRLRRLKTASEAIYRAVLSTMREHDTNSSEPATNVTPIKNLF